MTLTLKLFNNESKPSHELQFLAVWHSVAALQALKENNNLLFKKKKRQ